MNYPYMNPSPEACDRLPAFVLAGLPPQFQEAIATLRRARSQAAHQIECLIAAAPSLDPPARVDRQPRARRRR